jgi:antitoxin component YwqK of YwqJK toxin-antitoxin module
MRPRFIFLVCSILALLWLLLLWRYIPGTVRRDANGFVHGTGKLEYFYPNGKLKLDETYINGQIRVSKFYLPDGTVFATTNWQNGTGLEYGLNDDGSIRVVIPYRNGLAEGWAIEYGVDRTVSRRILYRNGERVYP